MSAAKKNEVVAETGAAPARPRNGKPAKIELPLHRRVDTSFLQYASYVIRDRAIPNLADGLKPVQRRILWSLHEKDDARFIKVATISGHCAQYHPHGEAAIGDSLVVVTNKRYLIEGQGNFGNIYTGDPAAAPRYIECRLTELARNEIFNNELTEFVPSYDGRNKEPVALPAKLPLLLMLGTEGIAVGMSCKILPHNFPELLQAQIAILKKQPFKLLPDFPTGGLMDAREYKDGAGAIKVRAKIKTRDETTVVIKEIPPTTTTDSLMASIEDAARKGKIKVKSVNEVLRENTAQLVDTLKRELQLRERKLEDELHFRTLERIFIEERIYKKIEQCKTNEAVVAAVRNGFKPFRRQLLRELTDADVERLLAVRIRRISLFDINIHREEMEQVKSALAATRKNLKNLTQPVIGHLERLLEKYAPLSPRLTRSSRYDEVDAKEAAFKAFKVAYDRESGYVGYKVSGEEFNVECTKFDKLILMFKDGHYKVTELPEKMFVGPDLCYCGLPNRERVFTCAYTDRKASYLKRFKFGGTILNKAYLCIPEKSRILFLAPDTPKILYVRYKPAPRQKISQQTCDPSQIEVKSPKTRGRQISNKDISSVTAEPTRGWDEKATTTKVTFA